MQHTELIDKVRKSVSGRNEVITQLITDPKIRKALFSTLHKKGCSYEDAVTHFTDAVLIFVKSCLKPDFNITSSLQNYLIGISKNLWYKEVTKSKKERLLDIDQPVTEDETPLSMLMKEELKNPIRKLLDQLDERCRKVMSLWAHNRKMTQIAEDMNYKSEGMARKKKHQCVRKMYAIIEKNPALKERLRDML